MHICIRVEFHICFILTEVNKMKIFFKKNKGKEISDEGRRRKKISRGPIVLLCARKKYKFLTHQKKRGVKI